MFRSIRVKNWKGLKSLEMQNLGKINLLVGANNVGKTSFLEILAFLAGKRPLDSLVSPMRSRIPDLITSMVSTSDLFSNYFSEMELSNTIELELESSPKTKVRLSFSLKPSDKTVSHKMLRELGNDAEAATATRDSVVLQVLLDDFQGEPISIGEIYESANGEIQIAQREGFVDSAPGVMFAPAGGLLASKWVMEMWGQLETQKSEQPLVDALKLIEPRIKSIKTALFAGQYRICADIGLRSLLPIQFLGGGVNHLFSLLLPISNPLISMVLLDEIENGFYRRHFNDLWVTLNRIAEIKGECQIFATTHSWECVETAIEFFADAPSDRFRVHRLERRKYQTACITYDNIEAMRALNQGHEVR